MQIPYSLSSIPAMVQKNIIPLMHNLRIFTLTGNLGAGKTTLIKEIFRQLGVTEHVTSPTFAYVNTYITPAGTTIHHFDLYRLASIQDFFAAGFDEYLQQQDALCFIEWPGIIEGFLQAPPYKTITCHLAIDYSQSGFDQRELIINQ